MEKKPVRILRELNPALPRLSDPARALPDDTQRLVRQSSVLRSATEVLRQLRVRGANPDRLNFPDCSTLLSIDSEVTAKGESLVGVGKERRSRTWLVTARMGRGESLKLALNEACLIPVASVAVPVEAAGGKSYRPVGVFSPTDGTPHGALFAWLPLPTRSGLPVHVNASFAVTSNRRALCEENEDDKFDTQPRWNVALMADAVCSAYVRLVADVAAFLAPPRDYEFASLWPDAERVAGVCAPLVKAFYDEVSGRAGPAVFSDGQRWVSVDNVVFLDCAAYESAELVRAALEVCRQSVVAGSSKVGVSNQHILLKISFPLET